MEVLLYISINQLNRITRLEDEENYHLRLSLLFSATQNLFRYFLKIIIVFVLARNLIFLQSKVKCP
jgi:hypothetical protein